MKERIIEWIVKVGILIGCGFSAYMLLTLLASVLRGGE